MSLMCVNLPASGCKCSKLTYCLHVLQSSNCLVQGKGHHNICDSGKVGTNIAGSYENRAVQ